MTLVGAAVALVPARAFIVLPPTPCSGSAVNLAVQTPDTGAPPFPGAESDPPYGQPARCGNDPESSEISRSFISPVGPNAIASAQFKMGEGSFGTVVHASAADFSNNGFGIAANAGGSFADSLIISGSSGPGTLVLPLHLTGSAVVSYSIGGSPLPPRAEGYFKLGCSGVTFAGSCADETLSFSASQAFDATLTARVPFTFGEEVAFQRAVDASAGFVPPYDVDHPDGPSGGFVEGHFMGTWQKAKVLDAASQEVAATISSASGFDYLNPVPEPEAWDAEAAALGALLALGRRRCGASER